MGDKIFDFNKEERGVLKELADQIHGQYKVPKQYHCDEELLKEMVAKVKVEVDLISRGVSSLTKRAIQDTRIPAVHALGQLEAAPHPSRLAMFVRIAKQDFGANVANAFEEWFEEVFEEKKYDDEE